LNRLVLLRFLQTVGEEPEEQPKVAAPPDGLQV
jgi:hypothetical protein